jgi:hypothetical protein
LRVVVVGVLLLLCGFASRQTLLFSAGAFKKKKGRTDATASGPWAFLQRALIFANKENSSL